jgi:uncharacterized membrane protein YbhN (UPF0104 family)
MTPQARPGGQFRFMRRMEVSVVLTAIIFVLGQAAAALRALPAHIVPVLLAMSVFNYVMRAGRWLIFSKAIDIDVPPAANALIYVAGFSMTTTPGKVGETLRLWLLKTGFDARYDRTATVLIADRLGDAAALCILLVLSAAWLGTYAYSSACAIAIIGGIVFLCMRPGFALLAVDGLYAGIGRGARLFVRARRVIRQLQTMASPSVFGLALLIGGLGWMSEGFSFYVLLNALGVSIHPLLCLFIFSFAMIVGAVSVLPGGLGSTEATMIGLLSLHGVKLDTAIVATAVVRITTLWFAVLLGVIALPFALRMVRRAAVR